MFLILWVIIGVVAGLAVNQVINQPKPEFVGNIVIGIFGALVGGFVFNVVGGRGVSEFNLWSLPCAGLGAMAVLGGFHALRRTGLGFR
jgi:uncharacterized membrane protein YeaQ/YmgE (transglycosylase-associated protein family)